MFKKSYFPEEFGFVETDLLESIWEHLEKFIPEQLNFASSYRTFRIFVVYTQHNLQANKNYHLHF